MTVEDMLDTMGRDHYWIEIFWIPLYNTRRGLTCIVRAKKLDDPTIVYEGAETEVSDALNSVYMQYLKQKGEQS